MKGESSGVGGDGDEGWVFVTLAFNRNSFFVAFGANQGSERLLFLHAELEETRLGGDEQLSFSSPGCRHIRRHGTHTDESNPISPGLSLCFFPLLS